MDSSKIAAFWGNFLLYQNHFPLDLFSDFVYITKVWVVDICGTKNSKAQISIFGRSENGFRNTIIWW